MKWKIWTKHAKNITAFCGAVILAACVPATAAAAEEYGTIVPGKILEFDEKSHYEFSAADETVILPEGDPYGMCCIAGNVMQAGEKLGVPAYKATDGAVKFAYIYNADALADEDAWHLVEDKSKKLDGKKLQEKIMNGALLLQTSRDGNNWIDAVTVCNALVDGRGVQNLYTATDAELLNGCYYRVVAAYKLGIRTKEGSFLGLNTDRHEYKKCAEVYEFYVLPQNDSTEATSDDQTYSLGTKVRTDQFAGYVGERPIDKKDPHYGWDLGHFYISGYTDETEDADGNTVFLKNVGDKVTLWFKLNQDIDRLNGNEDLSITADGEGYDQYFETPKMDFGRGTLIIRYTDYKNDKAEPEIYTNYLEANTVVGTDTKVQLFEEGDYEVALDYEVTNNKLIDKMGHYRIFFQISVRNGNCMIYPFDLESGMELTNSSMTPNGFRLDLAKSRYLNVNLKREKLKDSADGLVEDTRFNGPAKDGAEYTDEGIYTITVMNEYTNQLTTKKIYVGTNPVMRAYMVNDLTIPEINALVAGGAVIADDGTIRLAENQNVPEDGDRELIKEENDVAVPEEPEIEQQGFPVGAVAVGVCCVALAAVFIVGKHKKAKQNQEEANHEEGGENR